MRKVVKVFNIIMLIVMLCSGSYYLSDNSSGEKKQNNVEEEIQLSLLIEDGIEEESINIYRNAIARLPINTVKSFHDNNWSLMVVNRLKEEKENKLDTGLIDYEKKTIELVYNIGQEQSTLLHEFGHFFDYSLNFISSTEEFKIIYNIYKDNYIEYEYKNLKSLVSDKELNYSTLNEREFIATIFKEYILYPDYLKTYSPEAFDFIEKYLKEVK